MKPHQNPDRCALINGIRADPDNAVRRLVFADWCDENGEPDRATMIRYGEEILRERTRLGKHADKSSKYRKLMAEFLAWRHDAADRLSRLPGWVLISGKTRLTGDRTEGWSEPLHLFTMIRTQWAWWKKHGPAFVRSHPVSRVEFAGMSDGQLWYVTESLNKWMPVELRRQTYTIDNWIPWESKTNSEWMSQAAIQWALSQPVPD